MKFPLSCLRVAALSCALALSASAADSGAEFKAQVSKEIEGMKKQIQVMNDTVFSFAELGYQEYETSKYLTGLLEKEGFIVERGIAGMPTAWMASWGFGKPVISLGSDIDCIPQASQKPGVAYHDPILEGAPGHGEGHNSGQPLNIVAAIAVKRVAWCLRDRFATHYKIELPMSPTCLTVYVDNKETRRSTLRVMKVSCVQT
jgi:aminobenzoyl-glutamate utilization protein B